MFKSFFRLLEDPEQVLDAPKVDQAEIKYKNLNTLRQSMDRCDKGEMNTVMVEGVSYSINKKFCIYKDKRTRSWRRKKTR